MGVSKSKRLSSQCVIEFCDDIKRLKSYERSELYNLKRIHLTRFQTNCSTLRIACSSKRISKLTLALHGFLLTIIYTNQITDLLDDVDDLDDDTYDQILKLFDQWILEFEGIEIASLSQKKKFKKLISKKKSELLDLK